MTASPTAPAAMPSEEMVERLNKLADYNGAGMLEPLREAASEAAEEIARLGAELRAQKLLTQKMRELAARQKAAGKEYYDRALAAEAALAGLKHSILHADSTLDDDHKLADWFNEFAAAIRAEGE